MSKFMPRAEAPARKRKADEPQGVGWFVDELFAFDAQIDEQEAALRVLKQTRAKKEIKLLNLMRDQNVDGCRGKAAIANIKKTRHPTIKNRGKLDKWIVDHGAMHLLQNRVSSKVYFEMLEDGQKIPGVEVFEKVSLSITKRRK